MLKLSVPGCFLGRTPPLLDVRDRPIKNLHEVRLRQISGQEERNSNDNEEKKDVYRTQFVSNVRRVMQKCVQTRKTYGDRTGDVNYQDQRGRHPRILTALMLAGVLRHVQSGSPDLGVLGFVSKAQQIHDFLVPLFSQRGDNKLGLLGVIASASRCHYAARSLRSLFAGLNATSTFKSEGA